MGNKQQKEQNGRVCCFSYPAEPIPSHHPALADDVEQPSPCPALVIGIAVVTECQPLSNWSHVWSSQYFCFASSAWQPEHHSNIALEQDPRVSLCDPSIVSNVAFDLFHKHISLFLEAMLFSLSPCSFLQQSVLKPLFFWGQETCLHLHSKFTCVYFPFLLLSNFFPVFLKTNTISSFH